MTDYPENHRVKWTDNELKKLLKETKNKIDIETIANNHKRTIGSIKFKLFRYGTGIIKRFVGVRYEEFISKSIRW